LFAPLKLQLKDSSYWINFVFGVHSVAIASVAMFTPLEVFVRVVLVTVTLVSLWALVALPINQGVKALIWNPDAEIFATQGGDGVQTLHAMPDTLLCFPFLICIKLKARAPVANQWLILLPDMMSKEEWRRLQVLSRWSELDA
jgi:hypothetical protein